MQSRALADVVAERRRQVQIEGYDAQHDDALHHTGELVAAAACYVNEVCHRRHTRQTRLTFSSDGPPSGWPFEDAGWKPKGDRQDLVRAVAFILAELERMDRAAGWDHG